MKNQVILLVEDNPDDEELALRAFERSNIASPEVVVARDGVEALDYLFATGMHAERDADEMPAVVLLDLKLPKMDGFDVLRSIRGEPRTRCLPVVVLTSSREERDVAQSYSLGANSYVCKPVDFTEFVEAVRQLGVYWLLLNLSPRECIAGAGDA